MAASWAPTSAAEVVVLGGNAIVGRALELLLDSTDCVVRFLAEPSREALGSLGTQPRLVLLTPGLDAGRRKALLALLRSVPITAKVPVLELTEEEEEVWDGLASRYLLRLPWPCGAEDLRRRVRDVFFVGLGEGRGDDVSASLAIPAYDEEGRLLDTP